MAMWAIVRERFLFFSLFFFRVSHRRCIRGQPMEQNKRHAYVIRLVKRLFQPWKSKLETVVLVDIADFF